jgi:monooxygenase
MHVDVLIVGAGLSGVGAAHHLQTSFPDRTYTILEARDVNGERLFLCFATRW